MRYAAVVRAFSVVGLLGIQTWIAGTAAAQTIYNVPPDVAPASIGLGDVMNLDAGGIVADNFLADAGSTVAMSGGMMGRNFTANSATVTVDGGVIGSYFDAGAGTTVTLNDGIIGDGGTLASFEIASGAAAVLNGGDVTDAIRVFGGGSLTINGGHSGSVSSFGGSQTTIRGGVLEGFHSYSSNAVVDYYGGVFQRFTTSSTTKLTLHGYDFRFNGAPVAGLSAIGDTVTYNLPDQGVLSGTLSDGTPFALYDPDAVYLANNSMKLKLTAVAPPGPAMIHAPSDPVPLGIRDGQTLVVDAGGEAGPLFSAGSGSTLVVHGGTVGNGLEAVSASVTVNGGGVGNVTGLSGSTIGVHGGATGGIGLHSGSTLHTTGGATSFIANSSTSALVEGGVIRSARAMTGSQVTLHGTDFRLNGVPITGLSMVGDTLAYDVPSDGVLTAILADGTPALFARLPGSFNPFDAGTLALRLASAPPAVPPVIDAPSAPMPQGLHPGQSLILRDGAVVPSYFTALEGSSVVMHGGTIGNNFRAIDSTITIHDGTIGDNFFTYGASSVSMYGGTVGTMNARPGSTVVIHDGVFNAFSAAADTTVTIHGGQFLQIGSSVAGTASIYGGDFLNLSATSGSNVEVNDGSLGLSVRSGATVVIKGGTFRHLFNALNGGHLTLDGTDFRVDGLPVAGLDTVGNTVPLNVATTQILSGTLADGTPFAFSRADDDTLADGTITLRAAPAPAAGPALVDVPGNAVPRGIRAGQTLVLRGGGLLPDDFNAGRGSAVQIHGGVVGTNFEAVDAAVLITGGSITGEFDIFGSSIVDLYGSDFRLNGAVYPGLVNAGDSVIVGQRARALLTGTLMDGSPISLRLCTATQTCYTDADIGDDFVDTNATLRLTLRIAGDYNLDGHVDEQDYETWKNSFGATGDLAMDGNFNGVVDAGDYVVWRDHFGNTLGTGSGASVPEPAAFVCAAFAGFVVASRRLRSIA